MNVQEVESLVRDIIAWRVRAEYPDCSLDTVRHELARCSDAQIAEWFTLDVGAIRVALGQLGFTMGPMSKPG